MNDADEIRAVIDRQAITDLLYRYCRSVDRLDVPLGHSIWHADGYADYGAAVYQGDGRGMIDHVCAQHRQTLGHSHQMTNIVITLDGDHAGSESYCFATLRVGDPARPRQIMVWTRYADSWSRRDGRWGLDRRVAIRDLDEIRDAAPMTSPQDGRRDPTDPSYAVLKGLP